MEIASSTPCWSRTQLLLCSVPALITRNLILFASARVSVLTLALALARALAPALAARSRSHSAYNQCFGIRAGSPLSRAEMFCLAYGLMALRCVLHVRSSAPVVVSSVSSASIALPAGHLLYIGDDWLIVGETDPSRECWCAPSVSALGADFG